jgi:hypothetical protein
MPVMFFEEMIEVLRDFGRDIGLAALLADIGINIPNHHKFFSAPDLQLSLPGLQMTTTEIAPINRSTHFVTFRVL